MSHRFKGKKLNEVSLGDVSKRTLSKIAKRMNMACCICGWNEAPIDIHHITPKSKGGTNDVSNLTPLCPNCHRKAHSNLLDKSLIKSIDEIYGDEWKKYYYNSDNEWKQPLKELPVKSCPICDKIIPRFHETFCSNECFKKYQEKISRCPEKHILEHDVNNLGVTAAGKKYGVTHTQIARWCKRLGIERKMRKSPNAPVL